MKLIKLLIASLSLFYLSNINNSVYTMESKNDIKEDNKNINLKQIYIKAPIYNADNDLYFYNALDSKKPDNGALAALNQLFSVSSHLSLQFFNKFYYDLHNNNKDKKIIYRPDEVFKNLLINKHQYKLIEKYANVFFTKENSTILNKLQLYLMMLPNLLPQTNKIQNPIMINIKSEKNLLQDSKINPNMTLKELEKQILNTLKQDKYTDTVQNKDNKDLNKINNIFLNIPDFETLKYLYNAICYGDGTITIGNNSFELSGAALCTYNKDGSKMENEHYVAAKKRTNGKWALIDSLKENGYTYGENSQSNIDLDRLITRPENIYNHVNNYRNYILLPKLLIFRRVPSEQVKKENKKLNKDILLKINKINEQLFDILRIITKLPWKKDSNSYYNTFNEGVKIPSSIAEELKEKKYDITIWSNNECYYNDFEKQYIRLWCEKNSLKEKLYS